MSERPAPVDGSRAHAMVALAGFMGVGKSSIGRAAAEALGRRFFDTDALVVERLGQSIPELFRRGEEDRFRRTEADVIAELVELRPAPVVALGGGALGDPGTHELLLERAILVHLDLPWEVIEQLLPRLRRGRPLLASADVAAIHELFVAREATYRRAHVSLPLRREGVQAARDALLEALRPFGVVAPADPLPDPSLP